MQLSRLHDEADRLQSLCGAPNLSAIFGAGCTKNPRVMLVFMNPTAKNVSAHFSWIGLRAPWLGTKNVWKIFFDAGLLPQTLFQRTQELQPKQWTPSFASQVYAELKKQKVYVTNFAKCTQVDARPLKNTIFQKYRDLLLSEIASIDPKHIITFGNQVSSLLLERPLRVSGYRGRQKDILRIGRQSFDVYPTYYPVGQGRRNMPLAIKRIKAILSV